VQRRLLNQRRVLRKADRLFIPLPPFSDQEYWEEAGSMPNTYFLTRHGMNDLLGKIRAERKSRLEVWVPLVAAITGVLGAVTGLLAVFLNR
jgi:hypothetical protein